MVKKGKYDLITFTEALDIIKEIRPDVDQCFEYTNAYVFSSKEDDHYEGGYHHTPYVVVKETGEIICMPAYVLYHSNDAQEIGWRHMVSEKRIGKTPSGGDYSEVFYMDKKHNLVDKEKAEVAIFRECKEDGALVNETICLYNNRGKG